MVNSVDTAFVEKAAFAQVEETLGHGANDEARLASEEEHRAPFWQTFKKYRAAVFWSCVISMSIVMEGYDTILIGNFWAYPTFAKKYGHYDPAKKDYQVSARWQTGLGMGSTIGAIFGALINGWASSRFGYKKVMLVSLVFMNLFIFIIFFAPSVQVLLVGELCCGLTWGVFATTGPAYASEVVPLALRGYLTMYVNLCWAIGQFIAAGILRGLVNDPSQWGYRIPFAIQWVWPAPLLLIILFAPESPWYYVRQDNLDAARKVLKRLGRITDQEATGTLAMLVHTTKIEAEVTAGGSYWDCFKGTDFRRTEIACVAFAGQILSGSSFAYSPAYFFTNAGLSTDDSFSLGLGGTAFAFVGTILSWFLIGRFGRRTIYLFGESMSCVVLILIGILAAADNHGGGLWGQGALAMIWIFVYSITVGPVAYSIVSEISAVRLRPQTVVLARNFYQLVNIISQVLVPYMLNPEAFNWKGKTGFFWAGTSLCMAIWAYFRLPEPRGRTYEELDILFAKKIRAKDFSKTHVDAYAEADVEVPKENK